MLLNEDQRMVRDSVRAFVQERIAPKAAAWDKSHEFPAAELKGLAELGCYGIAVPDQYGGAGLDYMTLAIILEEIAAGDGGTSTVVSVSPRNSSPSSMAKRLSLAKYGHSMRWRWP